MRGERVPRSPASPLTSSRVAPILASTLSVAKAGRPQRRQFAGFISSPYLPSGTINRTTPSLHLGPGNRQAFSHEPLELTQEL